MALTRFTLGQVKDLVWSLLDGNTEMFQDDEVTAAINEAHRIGNLNCAWSTATLPISTTTTIANRHIYDVPAGIAFPQRVVFEDQVLEKSPIAALANNWPRFLQDTTGNLGMQVSRWSPIGIKKFVIHPADSVGGGNLYVTGIAEITPVVEDSEYVYVPKESITTLVEYAAHIVQCKLQGVPFMQSLALFRNFQALMNLQKYWLSYNQPTMYFDQKSETKD